MTGVLVVAALLLVGAGATKLADPGDTARALGVPAALVRAGAAVELALGLMTVATGSPALAWAVAASYLAFTGWITAALARHAPLATCGCFGEPDTPPTILHVVIDAALALGSAAAAWGGRARIGVVLVAVGAVGAYVTFLALSALPRTLAAARR